MRQIKAGLVVVALLLSVMTGIGVQPHEASAASCSITAYTPWNGAGNQAVGGASINCSGSTFTYYWCLYQSGRGCVITLYSYNVSGGIYRTPACNKVYAGPYQFQSYAYAKDNATGLTVPGSSRWSAAIYLNGGC